MDAAGEASPDDRVPGDPGDDHADDGDDDEDLDAFLVLLESRLRADFTSPDLSRIVSSQGTASGGSGPGKVGGIGGGGAALTTLPSGNPSTPAKFLRLIRKVFRRAAKPIKIRSLLSVMGLDSDAIVEAKARGGNGASGRLTFRTDDPSEEAEDDALKGRKTDGVVWELLSDAEGDDELWVRVVAGIVRGIMFERSPTASGGKKEAEAEKQLRKIADGVLKKAGQASDAASKRSAEARRRLSMEDDDEGEVDERKARLLETFQIGADLRPSYAPLRYSLLEPAAVTSLIPEADTNTDFAPNMDAEVLRADAEVERKRAEEDQKESLLRKQRGATNAANSAGRGNGAAGRASNGSSSANPLGSRAHGAVLAGRTRGRFSNAGRGGRGSAGGGSSLFRPSNTIGRGGGRVGMAGGRMAGRAGRGALVGRGALAGRAGRAGSLSKFGAGRGGGRLGAGRGTASGTVARAPLQRRAPGGARAILSAKSSAGGSGGGGGGAGPGGESKTKMIDVSEVEDLNKAQKEREKIEGLSAVQARKLERKRKLMENAKASGLKSKELKRGRMRMDFGTGDAAKEETAKGASPEEEAPKEGDGRKGGKERQVEDGKLHQQPKQEEEQKPNQDQQQEQQPSQEQHQEEEEQQLQTQQQHAQPDHFQQEQLQRLRMMQEQMMAASMQQQIPPQQLMQQQYAYPQQQHLPQHQMAQHHLLQHQQFHQHQLQQRQFQQQQFQQHPYAQGQYQQAQYHPQQSAPQPYPPNQLHPQQHPLEHHPPQQPPQQEGETLESILSKCNKLSRQDLASIQQFFANRASSDRLPIQMPDGGDPSTGVWKVKLNEDKATVPMTGETVKETLYLELDYGTWGYKKTRKVKRK